MKQSGNIKTIESAIRHFEWKLTNHWKPTEKDIEAYNFMVEYISQKQKESIIDNQLFGKLYIYLYGQFMTYYKCSFEDEIPQKELNKLIASNLSTLICDLTDKQNLFDMENYLKQNHSLKGYKNTETEETAENIEIMVNAAINNFK